MGCQKRVEVLRLRLKECSGQIESCVLLCAILCVAILPFHLHGALLLHRLVWVDASRLVGPALLAVVAAGFIFMRIDAWERAASSCYLRVITCVSGVASLGCSFMSVYASHARLVYMVLSAALAGLFFVCAVARLSACVRDYSAIDCLLVVVAGVALYAVAKCLLVTCGDTALLLLVPLLSLVIVSSHFYACRSAGRGRSEIPPREVALPDGGDLPACPRVLRHDLSGLVQYVQGAWGLTPRERDVLPGLAHGHSIGRIAQAQSVSVNTIRTHVKGIYAKAGVHSQQELMALLESIEAGLER